ncbi:helix-turn-helix domain-containing protein [Nonomuraea dietziae]|uniref:Sugar diacid utilization regulator n=2 Tax=Nonomuraea dietziae TaxID=65515 RepID=A0A7W5YD82_9ACTN|nr:helix-turn-helix domain-containing protein [Nonomuraea dietziae]MBB3733191.1 sugar diacid utilization regulator [Nonomuraea dietziae]
MYKGDDLRRLAGPAQPRPATGVRLLEDLRTVVDQPPGAVLVLTGEASLRATGYRLEVVLRDAGAAGAAALVLTAPVEVARSAAALAERAGVALLAAPDGTELAGLVVAVERAIAGDAADALVRAEKAVRGVLAAAGASERMAAEAGAALGVEVAADFSAQERDDHLGRATRIVLKLAELAAAAGPSEEAPARSRAQVLTELLVAPEKQAQELAPRARTLGLPVDGWHVVLRMEGPEPYALLDTLATRAARLVRELVGPEWSVTMADGALIVVRTSAHDPGRAGLRAAARDAALLLERVRPAGADLRCGVSTAHQGLLGLRTSASEARTAVRRGSSALTTYDLAGLDRMLEEWYSSDAAQQAVRELLQPIMEQKKAGLLLEILRAYLDHHGSPARAAEEVRMHRNAVSRNVRRIEELLQADLDDPQQRLALQLACRAARV